MRVRSGPCARRAAAVAVVVERVDAERALPVHDPLASRPARRGGSPACRTVGGWPCRNDSAPTIDGDPGGRGAASNGKASWTSRTARSAFDSDAARGRSFRPRRREASATLRGRCPPLPTHHRPDAAPPLPADDPSIFEMDLRGLRHHWARRAALPPISAETMTGADRRAQALGIPGGAPDGARRDRGGGRGQGARDDTRRAGGRARSSSCAAPATTAATATSRPAGWRSPAPR